MSDESKDAETVRRNISESADKIRLATKLTRGTGTRSQEKIEVKIKGDDAAEAVNKLNETLELLAETADTARNISPERTPDTDE
jgi:hypothetical protein